jgi:hypothetical protein
MAAGRHAIPLTTAVKRRWKKAEVVGLLETDVTKQYGSYMITLKHLFRGL